MLPAEIRSFQSLLQEALRRLLEFVALPLREDVIVALSAQGKLLSTSSEGTLSGVWSLMTLAWADYLQLGADLSNAVRAALAVECLLCAFDLLDDIEDGDVTPTLQVLGVARAANVATGLLFLAQRSLCADSAVMQGTQWRLWNTFIECNLLACGGQHWDLVAEKQPVEDFQQEDALLLAEAKSGSLMRLACLFGALSVDASQDICDLVADIGQALGVAHQLDNDAHDLASALQDGSVLAHASSRMSLAVKSDLRRNKKTLPIVIAAQQKTLQTGLAPADMRTQEALLEEAIRATWGACLVYRNAVRASLVRLKAIVERPLSPALEHLIGVT
jgi:geranylgeranyl pyrophosphate synthase